MFVVASLRGLLDGRNEKGIFFLVSSGKIGGCWLRAGGGVLHGIL